MPVIMAAWTTGQCGGSQVQFLDKVFYMPVGVLRVASYVHVRQVPQVQSARRQSRSHCCCSFTPESQYIDKVVDVPVVVRMPVVVQRQVL